jgi:hypothetical protein
MWRAIKTIFVALICVAIFLVGALWPFIETLWR